MSFFVEANRTLYLANFGNFNKVVFITVFCFSKCVHSESNTNYPVIPKKYDGNSIKTNPIWLLIKNKNIYLLVIYIYEKKNTSWFNLFLSKKSPSVLARNFSRQHSIISFKLKARSIRLKLKLVFVQFVFLSFFNYHVW